MRECFINKEKYWDIKAGEEVSKDAVCEKEISEIDRSVLPVEDSYFSVTTDECSKYLQKIEAEIYQDFYDTLD